MMPAGIHRIRVLRIGAAAVLLAFMGTAGAQERREGRVWGGVGFMSGDVTYQIGGHFSSPQGFADYHFPISELKWPLDVPVAVAGGELPLGESFELRGEFSKNLQSAAGKMKDSDWTDTLNPSIKTIYSESSAVLQSYSGDLALRYWLRSRQGRRLHAAEFALGIGWLYERSDWDARDLDQWYPQNPAVPHTIVDGLVGTYAASVSMPYLEVAARHSAGRGWGIGGALAFSPVAMIEDDDDHVLREMRSTSRATGLAGRLSLEARYDGPVWFLAFSGEALRFSARGRDHTVIYGGLGRGSEWSLDHEINGTRYRLTASAGVKF